MTGNAVTSAFGAAAGTSVTGTVDCPAGRVLLGGGATATTNQTGNSSRFALRTSAPVDADAWRGIAVVTTRAVRRPDRDHPPLRDLHDMTTRSPASVAVLVAALVVIVCAVLLVTEARYRSCIARAEAPEGARRLRTAPLTARASP